MIGLYGLGGALWSLGVDAMKARVQRPRQVVVSEQERYHRAKLALHAQIVQTARQVFDETKRFQP